MKTVSFLTFSIVKQNKKMSKPELVLSEKIIREAKAKIASHNEFKTAYNRELAFDIDLFRYFKVGENKTSQILASFLNPNGAHGQAELFMSIFTEILRNKLEGRSQDAMKNPKDDEVQQRFLTAMNLLDGLRIKPEQSIDRVEKSTKPGKRRIDIYITTRNFAIAIENKVWAKDQIDQLMDYDKFLADRHGQNYLLVYLTPHGKKPADVSISMDNWNERLAAGTICSLSYKNDILPMMEEWEAKCKAERVRSFLREFKTHLHVKFLGGNNLNMTKALENIIRIDAETVKSLAYSYQALEKEARDKIDWVAKKFKTRYSEEVKNIKPLDTFHSSEQYYVFKISLKTGSSSATDENEIMTNQVYVHLSEKNLQLRLTYYIEVGSSSAVSEKVSKVWNEALDDQIEYIERKEKTEVTLLLLKPEISKQQIFSLMDGKVNLIKKVIQY